MILEKLKQFVALFTDMSLPAYPPRVPAELVPPSDGRVFAWIRTRGATKSPLQGVVLRDKTVGPKLEIVGKMYVIQPHLYCLTINELSKIYPAPPVPPDHEVAS